MPKGLLQWRNSIENNKRTLPLPEGTSLAQCKQLKEGPSTLWGALFSLPVNEMEGPEIQMLTLYCRNYNFKTLICYVYEIMPFTAS